MVSDDYLIEKYALLSAEGQSHKYYVMDWLARRQTVNFTITSIQK